MDTANDDHVERWSQHHSAFHHLGIGALRENLERVDIDAVKRELAAALSKLEGAIQTGTAPSEWLYGAVSFAKTVRSEHRLDG